MMKVGVSSMVYLVVLLVGMVASGMLVEQVAGQQGGSCGNTFFSSLVQLIPCRPAVTPFSPIPPTEACCNAVQMLGRACLCVLINGPPISGVDRNMAMELPAKCAANFQPCEIGV